ncbi:glycerol-3-phosphate responsive antiterminator [Acidaminobacter sp. JC074]|uniref:glycerol-3-phosphate responsive antiterminator n=1 Tax=Acidaminobacter sp. JC074 TaxID=2530199 RepID=UPI001F0F3342|nr:glycerol-3-phosphate responsive antiterminator [Acidaminobacter sp. JC074]MCH4886507.1 glycerol-3-phosphate responsive antiterminator [Acidaminobacter sp. JC074]
MGNKIVDSLHNNPIIAAVSDEKNLNEALGADVEIVFILNSSIFDLDDQIKKIQKAHKLAFVHVDLVDGISSNKTGIRYICEVFKPDGIITTKSHLISACKHYDVMTIQRIFLLDSLSLETGIGSINACNPDAVEILPNVVPKIVNKMVKEVRKPIITGGLITEKEDIMNSLKAGAIGVSTSKVDIWGC